MQMPITGRLHCETIFPARKAQSDWDIRYPGILDDDGGYLGTFVDDVLNYL